MSLGRGAEVALHIFSLLFQTGTQRAISMATTSSSRRWQLATRFHFATQNKRHRATQQFESWSPHIPRPEICFNISVGTE